MGRKIMNYTIVTSGTVTGAVVLYLLGEAVNAYVRHGHVRPLLVIMPGMAGLLLIVVAVVDAMVRLVSRKTVR